MQSTGFNGHRLWRGWQSCGHRRDLIALNAHSKSGLEQGGGPVLVRDEGQLNEQTLAERSVGLGVVHMHSLCMSYIRCYIR